MTHFAISKAIFLFHVLTSAESKMIEGNLPNASLITNLINQYVEPYFKSLHLQHNDTYNFQTFKETIIKNVITQKILELKPILQDEDYKVIESEENLTLNGGEETTIIEFTPNTKNNKEIARNRKGDKPDMLKADIKAYKKLREKIMKALKQEPVSDKTVKLVTKTFDGLLAKLIGSQCMWKSADNAEKTFPFGKTDEDILLKIHNITKKEWEHFKHQYVKLTQNKFVNETLLLFNRMKDFFSRINNTMAMPHKYKVNCRLIKLKATKKDYTDVINSNVLRDNNDVDECADFQICSNEFTTFMTDFYKSLNDTAVSAFRNYAAMYSRDVTSDHSVEKDSVVDLINNVSNTVERKIVRIFAKETKKIKLDENKNKEANIKILTRIINNTTGHVKRHMKKHLEFYLKSLRLRLLLNVKRDIDVNLNVDLGNLARDFISRICTVFTTCNGRYLSRRAQQVLNPWGNLHVTDGKSVYVKVQMTFDDDLKRTLMSHRRMLENNLQGKDDKIKNKDIRRINDTYKNVNVTRTTRTDFSSHFTTKIDSHRNISNIGYKANIGHNKIYIEMKPILNYI